MSTAKRAAASKITWSRRALRDLAEIDAYIALDDPAAAEKWVDRLIDKAHAAAASPGAGRIVPERAERQVREVLLRNYRIVCQVRPSGIVVLTVFEGHRAFPSLDDD